MELEELRDKELEALELYRKGKAEAPIMYRAMPMGFKAATDETAGGLVTFVASEESEDRMGDVITIAGWQLDNFKKNPVFLYAHDQTFPPIGKVEKIAPDGKQLVAGVKFDDNDDFAKMIHSKYDNNFMKAVSVGFRGLEFEERPMKDAKSRSKGLLFTKQELVELSAVPVPAHPKALKKALGMRSYFWMPIVQEPEPAPIPDGVLSETDKQDILIAIQSLKEA